ncbi:hypothetical protein DFP73DRAFT_613302 [Morchella snyderi]|nr:hypothetical protein DFP73DRAFT_613302 [Morchella snyderi]
MAINKQSQSHKQSQSRKAHTQGNPPDKYLPPEAPAAPRRKGTVKEILAMRERGYDRDNFTQTSPPQEMQGFLNKPNQRKNRLAAFQGEEEEQERKQVIKHPIQSYRKSLERCFFKSNFSMDQNIPQRRKSSLRNKPTTSTESEDEYDAGMEKMRLQQNRLLKEKKQVKSRIDTFTSKGEVSITTKDMSQRNASMVDNKRIHSPESPDHSAPSLPQSDRAKIPVQKAPKRIRLEDYRRTRESGNITLRRELAEGWREAPHQPKHDISGNRFGEEHRAHSILEKEDSETSTARERLVGGNHAQVGVGLERSKPYSATGLDRGLKVKNPRPNHNMAAEPRKGETIAKAFKDNLQKQAETSKADRRQKGLDVLYDNLLAKAIPLVRGFEVVLDEAYTEQTWCKQLAERIERTVDNDGKTEHNAYIKKCRSILFNLKRNETLFALLIAGSVAPERLASMSSEQMISEEEREWRQNEREKATAKCTIVNEIQKPHIRKTHRGEELVEDLHQTSSREPISDSLFSSPEPRPTNVDGGKTTPETQFCLSKVHAQIPPIQHPILASYTSKQRAKSMRDTSLSNNLPQARGIPAPQVTGSHNHSTLNEQRKWSPSQRWITKPDENGPFDTNRGGDVLQAPDSKNSTDGYQCNRHCSPPYTHFEELSESQRCATPPYSPPTSLPYSPIGAVFEVRGPGNEHAEAEELVQDQEECSEDEWWSQPPHPFIDLTTDDDFEITGSRTLITPSNPVQIPRPYGEGESQANCTLFRSNHSGRVPSPASYEIGDYSTLDFGSNWENNTVWDSSPTIGHSPSTSRHHNQEHINMDNSHGHDEHVHEYEGLSEGYEYHVQQSGNRNPVDLQAHHMSFKDYDNRYNGSVSHYQYSVGQIEANISQYGNTSNSTGLPSDRGMQRSVQGTDVDSQRVRRTTPQAYKQHNRTELYEREGDHYGSSSCHPQKRSSNMHGTQHNPGPALGLQTGPDYYSPAVRTEPAPSAAKPRPQNSYPSSHRSYEPRPDLKYR